VDLDEQIAAAADARSPFGEVPGRGTPLTWLGSYASSRAWLTQHWPAVRAGVLSDTERLRSSGWFESGRLYAPETFSPGDGPALRAASLGLNPETMSVFDLAIQPDASRTMDDFMLRVLATTVARAERLVTSEFAFLPASTAVTLLGAFRPDRELYLAARLPHRRMFVFFGAPMRFTHQSTWWDPNHVSVLDRIDVAIARNNNLPLEVAKSRLPSNLYRNGGAVVGVWVEADEEGRLIDDIGFVGFENVDGRLVDPRLIIGDINRATLAPLVENLVCALCWGHWVVNGERPRLPDPTTREFRRLLGTSSFKRQSRSGAVDGVRLLQISTETVRSHPHSVEGGQRSVAPHLRRGHFRRVRIVTRDPEGKRSRSRQGEQGIDWHYEGRWIPPTVVNPQRNTGVGIDRVYLLPEPPPPEEYVAYTSSVLSESIDGSTEEEHPQT